MDEVGGAIERVDDPDEFCVVLRTVRAAGLFGHDAVVRVRGQQGFNDDGLGSLVHFGDEIVGLLGGHAHRFHIKRRPVDDRAGKTRRLDGDIEHGVEIAGHG